MRLESDGSMETVHFKCGLVYDGLEEPFLEYVGTDPDDYFVFEFGDGDGVRAKQKGDTLDWIDGSVYYKLLERAEPEGGSSSSLFEGNWKTWDKYGVKEGTVTIQDLDPSGCEAHFLLLQWDDDSSPVKLRFTGREGDRFSFECHGDADTAVFVSDGDRIIWGDGCVYMRIRTPEKDVDIVGTTISEKILESGTADTNSPGASGDDAIDFERTGNITCEPIPSGSGTGNATTLPRDWGDDSTGAKEFTTPRKFFDTGISSENQWEFLMKSYNDLGYGNWTAGTTTTCLGHYDKDQDVDTGVPYCFYLYGYFDLAKEWESKLQGYNEVVKEWESKLQGYNDVSYQLDGLPLRQVNHRLCCGGDMEAYWTYSDMTGCFCIANRDGTWIA